VGKIFTLDIFLLAIVNDIASSLIGSYFQSSELTTTKTFMACSQFFFLSSSNTIQANCSLTNILSTYSPYIASCLFMSMAINRSVDFTKINSNVGLVPNYETKKLEDVMNEPIDCIRTLQNTTPIKVGPMPKGVCPYIILDEIWVKESLLCLLSNSVRYSNGGVITINTEIISARESDRGAYRETESPFKERDEIELSEDSDRTLSRNESERGAGPGSGLYIRITVMDNGVGIPPRQREFIFRPLRPAQKPSGTSSYHAISVSAG
jgi:signal transduction histidine kinase